MSGHSHWNYCDQETWKHVSGSQSNGKRQSPVAICDAQVVKSPALVPLKFEHWGTFSGGQAKNNGHGINFSPATHDAKFINHKGTYTLQQFHMHWGQKPGEGSEHTLNGKQYEAEIHFVHLKEGADPKAPKGDSYAVLGVFCQEDHCEPAGAWKQLKIPTECGAELPLCDVNYKEFLSADTGSYYHYEGSLTTPPCSEVVMWYVLKNPVKIPTAILQKFRQIKDSEGHEVVTNFRHVQPLHDRQVQTCPICQCHN